MYTVETQTLPAELRNLPEVEYPEEVIEELDREFEVVRARLATGQAKVYSDVKDLFRDLKKDNG